MDCGEGKMSLIGAYHFPELSEQTSSVVKRVPQLIRNTQTSLRKTQNPKTFFDNVGRVSSGTDLSVALGSCKFPLNEALMVRRRGGVGV